MSIVHARPNNLVGLSLYQLCSVYTLEEIESPVIIIN